MMSETSSRKECHAEFRHPISGERLMRDRGGDLCNQQGKVIFEQHEGSFDFVSDAESLEEREHYDQEYSDGGWATKESLDSVDFHKLWDLDVSSSEYLQSMGDVAGKRVLLIGNGTSVKEFFFVRLGAHVTFTDLSFQAVEYAKRRYNESRFGYDYPAGCEFHAVNAYHLPFMDNSFDIICADAVIHHMDDLKALFIGIHRCLKLGGICRFADTAYSPIWQSAKRGVLRPLQKSVHEKDGISPEDKKATNRGGYTRDELDQIRVQLGFKSLYYKRVALFDYLLWRARCKLNAQWLLAFRPTARLVDRLIARTSIMERQGIALVLGFDR